MRTQEYLNFHNLCMLKGICFSRRSPYGYTVKTYIAADISDLQISALFYYFFTEAYVIGDGAFYMYQHNFVDHAFLMRVHSICFFCFLRNEKTITLLLLKQKKKKKKKKKKKNAPYLQYFSLAVLS